MDGSALHGVVLAGGRGRRMGAPKGGLRSGRRTWAERAAELLSRHCPEVWISIAEGAENPAPGFPAVPDPPGPGRGPLAGMLAVWGRSRAVDLLVLACDYPSLTPDVLSALVSADRARHDVLLASDGERDHPLVALWRASACDTVERRVTAGRLRVGECVAALRVSRVFFAKEILTNVNRPPELPPDTSLP